MEGATELLLVERNYYGRTFEADLHEAGIGRCARPARTNNPAS